MRASERVEGTTRKFPHTESVESIAPAIACLRSSPAISHLAGEPDPALLVPTDNWTNRSHSLRANCSSPFLLIFLSFSFYFYALCSHRSLFSFSFLSFLFLSQHFTRTLFLSIFLHLSYPPLHSFPLLPSLVYVSLSTLITLFSVYVFQKTLFHSEKESGVINSRTERIIFDNCEKRKSKNTIKIYSAFYVNYLFTILICLLESI